MQNVRLMGVDVGNDAIKVVMLEENNGDAAIKKCEVMNVLSPGYSRRNYGVKKAHLSNLLDVTVYEESKQAERRSFGRYFVGGLAYKENRGDIIERTAEDIKAESDDTIILLTTSIAYALFNPGNPIKTENVALGTLLPTEEFFNDKDDLRQKFQEKLLNKTYTVEFHDPEFLGAKITINIIDEEINPEGAAAALAYSFNIDGNEKEDIGNIMEEVHLGIDIGSVTTDVSVFEYGEFSPKGHFGVLLGTSQPLDKIAADIKDEWDADITRHQLDYIIRNNKKLVINVNGKSQDITEELKKHKDEKFGHFIKLLVNNINKELRIRGVNTAFISRVNMAGGGSILYIDGFKKEFKKDNVYLAEDARYANATGALISVILKRKLSEAAADEVLS